MTDDNNEVIVEFLRARGHSDEDIQKVLAKLAAYEDETMRQSVFDSIAGGGFDLDQIIDDALKDE